MYQTWLPLMNIHIGIRKIISLVNAIWFIIFDEKTTKPVYKKPLTQAHFHVLEL